MVRSRVPPTDLATSQESSNPFPYSVANAKKLLTSHGWKVVPSGVTTCVKPGTGAGECGAGITNGEGLSFQYLYENGAVSFNNQILELANSWAQLASSCSSSPSPSVTSSAQPSRHVWRAGLPLGHRQLGRGGSTRPTSTRLVKKSSPLAQGRTPASTPTDC